MPREMQLMCRGDGRGVNNKYWPLVHIWAFGGSASEHGYVMYCGRNASSYVCFGPGPEPDDPRCEDCKKNLEEFKRRNTQPYRLRDIYGLWEKTA